MLTTLRQRITTTLPLTLRLLLFLLSITVIVAVARPILYRSLTQPSQTTILTRWADATQQGDFATAESYMQLNPLVQEIWLEQTRSYQQQGRMGMYHLVQQRWTGNSLNATLYWHTELTTQPESGQGMPGMNDPQAPAGDAMAGVASMPDGSKVASTIPLCTQVQVGPDGKVVPLTAYHACAPAELNQ